jgi:hypothetical protein
MVEVCKVVTRGLNDIVSEGVEEGRVCVKWTAGVVVREPDGFAIQGIVGAG